MTSVGSTVSPFVYGLMLNTPVVYSCIGAFKTNHIVLNAPAVYKHDKHISPFITVNSRCSTCATLVDTAASVTVTAALPLVLLF